MRTMVETDLQTFFEQQLDPAANHMAAFTSNDPTDREAFDNHWVKIIADESIKIKTILYQGKVAGYVLVHSWFGEAEVSYWLGREYWGLGIATRALSIFLSEYKARPLYARVVKDNLASVRVLEKCGFRVAGEDKGFANARGKEVEELILKLGKIAN